MPTVPCEFRRFVPRDEWFFFGTSAGARRKHVRCPLCKKRLKLRTIPDHWPHRGIVGYQIPPHKVTAKKMGVQLRLPYVKKG